MTFNVQFQLEPMTLSAEMGVIYDTTGDEYERGYRDGKAAEQGTTDGIIDRSISGAYVNDRITAIGHSTFYNCARLTSAGAASATKIGAYAFGGARALASASFPMATLIDANAFQNCTALASADFPNCTDLSGSAFSDCTNLAEINFPRATWVGGRTFLNCPKLAHADFPAVVSIGNLSFSGCTALAVLVLRADEVCTLQNVNAFTNTPIASGTGYIYVPDELVDAYKAAANWSAYAAQIRPLSELKE